MKYLAFLICLLPVTAWAGETTCDKPDKVQDFLEFRRQETLIGAGVEQDGRRIQLYVNGATGEWTIVTKHPHGLDCLSRHGENWRFEVYTPGQPATYQF